LSKEQNVKRRDRVYAQLHFNICKKIWGKLHKEHRYEHVPKLLEIIHECNIIDTTSSDGKNRP
jgi:hypothetical protein